VRDSNQESSPSARIGLQRKKLNNSLSKSITDSLEEYGSNDDDSESYQQQEVKKTPTIGTLMRAMSMHKRLEKKLEKADTVVVKDKTNP